MKSKSPSGYMQVWREGPPENYIWANIPLLCGSFDLKWIELSGREWLNCEKLHVIALTSFRSELEKEMRKPSQKEPQTQFQRQSVWKWSYFLSPWKASHPDGRPGQVTSWLMESNVFPESASCRVLVDCNRKPPIWYFRKDRRRPSPSFTVKFFRLKSNFCLATIKLYLSRATHRRTSWSQT